MSDIYTVAATFTTATFVNQGLTYIADVFMCDAGPIKCVVKAGDPVLAGACLETLILDEITKIPGVMSAPNVISILNSITSKGGSHGGLLILAFENMEGKVTTSLVFDKLVSGTPLGTEERTSPNASMTGEGVLSEDTSVSFLESKVLLDYFKKQATSNNITGAFDVSGQPGGHEAYMRSTMVDSVYKGDFKVNVSSTSDMDSIIDSIKNTKPEDAVKL